MKHTTIVSRFPDGFSPTPGMQPFYLVRQEKMALREGGILATHSVGFRYAGYFRAVKASAPKVCLGGLANGVSAITAAPAVTAPDTLEALKYGLMTAQMRLMPPAELDLAPLFTDKKTELLATANEALAESDSPYRLDEVVFGLADTYILDNANQPGQLYSGFIMGQSGMHQVTVHAPKGIPGEWQCVCGAYSGPGSACETCGLACPELASPAG